MGARSRSRAVKDPVTGKPVKTLDSPLSYSSVKSLSPTREPVAWLLSLIPFRNEVLLFCLAAMVRFWRIAEPGGVVFDESHFGKFTAHYQRGSYVFDIHPPLGKITFAALGSLVGYDYKGCNFDDIGTPYDPNTCQYHLLRGISATFGSLLAPLTYSIARKLGASRDGAITAACFVIFDMLNTIESRLVLMDAQLMFWSAMSLWLGLKFWALYDPRDGSESTLTPSQINKWCVAIGVVCGLAISVKWTALVNPGMVAVESFFGIWFLHRRRVPMVELFKIAGTVIATYIAVFYVHFWYLPKTGDRASAFVPAEFSMGYETTLLNHPEYSPDRQYSFWYSFFMLNYEMFLVNSKITQPHHWGSRFNQWVINARGVAYWGGPTHPDGYVDHTIRRTVYLIGNPLVVWTCFAGILTFIVAGFVYLRYRSWQGCTIDPKLVTALRCCSFGFVAWIMNLAPYTAVERSSFTYHYMPGLLHAEILTAILVDRVAGKQYRRYVLGALLAIVIASFIYFSPWVYALPQQEFGINRRRWMQGWD